MPTHAQNAGLAVARTHPARTSTELETSDFALGGCRYRRIRLPSPPPVRLTALTDAEFDVAMRAAQGESTKQIARARRTSARTVDNQLASAYRKLGVTCRIDLYRRLFIEDEP